MTLREMFSNAGLTVTKASVLALGLGLLAAASATANVVTYTSFRGAPYELTEWQGANITLLTQSAALDVPTINGIVNTLDGAWSVYHDLTGRRPSFNAPTTINRRATIAEVPNGQTCGARCAYLGSNGIEVMPPTGTFCTTG
jgi:hypothetical protein